VRSGNCTSAVAIEPQPGAHAPEGRGNAHAENRRQPTVQGLGARPQEALHVCPGNAAAPRTRRQPQISGEDFAGML